MVNFLGLILTPVKPLLTRLAQNKHLFTPYMYLMTNIEPI